MLGAYDGETLVSTVSLLLDTPPNQQHRAEIGKMMTHPRHRGRGAAAALLAEAERLAAANGRTLLNLDTAADDGASGLYEKAGYVLAGSIPDFAFKPHGGLTATKIYWKRIAPPRTNRARREDGRRKFRGFSSTAAGIEERTIDAAIGLGTPDFRGSVGGADTL